MRAQKEKLAFLYYSSIFCKWWDLGGMTSIYIKIGGIHPTSNRPQPTTPRISLLLHVESKSYKKLTALIMHSCPCYESILLIWSIPNALKLTISQKSILQIQNILMAMSKMVCINKLIHMFTHFGFARQKRFKKCPSLTKLLPRSGLHKLWTVLIS